MSIAELKVVVEAYLQLSFPGLEEHPLFAQGDSASQVSMFETLFYQAANNARKYAEKQHDFNASNFVMVGSIPSDGTGLSLNAMEVNGTSTVYQVKTIKTVYLVNTDGDHVPIRHETKDRLAHRLIEQDDRRPYDECNETLESKCLVFGDKVFLYPSNTTADVPIAIDASIWLPEYTSAGSGLTDSLLTYGSDYMQWACICEMNYIVQRFVPRQEGSLPPPTKERDMALRALIDWDCYKTDALRNIELD